MKKLILLAAVCVSLCAVSNVFAQNVINGNYVDEISAGQDLNLTTHTTVVNDFYIEGSYSLTPTAWQEINGSYVNISTQALMTVGNISLNNSRMLIDNINNYSDGLYAYGASLFAGGFNLGNVNLNYNSLDLINLSSPCVAYGTIADLYDFQTIGDVNLIGNSASASNIENLYQIYGASLYMYAQPSTSVVSIFVGNNNVSVFNSTAQDITGVSFNVAANYDAKINNNWVDISQSDLSGPVLGVDGSFDYYYTYDNEIKSFAQVNDNLLVIKNSTNTASYAQVIGINIDSVNNITANNNQIDIGNFYIENDAELTGARINWAHLSAQSDYNSVKINALNVDGFFNITGVESYGGDWQMYENLGWQYGNFDTNHNALLIGNSHFNSADFFGVRNDVEGGTGNANNNSVIFNNSDAVMGQIQGVYVDACGYTQGIFTNQNLLSITNFGLDKAVGVRIYGGFDYSTYTITANQNLTEVSAAAGAMDYVYGVDIENYAGDIIANENKININSAAIDTVYNVQAEAAGYAVTANGNEINIYNAGQNDVLGQVITANIVNGSTVIANNNALTIKDAKTGGQLIAVSAGGDTASANFNRVNLENIDLDGNYSVTAGAALGVLEVLNYESQALNNTVSIKNISNGDLVALGAEVVTQNGLALADSNSVIIDGEFSNVAIDVVGAVAYSFNGNAQANNNAVIINSDISQAASIIGGEALGNIADAQVKAINNTVTVNAVIEANELIGGLVNNSGAGGQDGFTGNTLNAKSTGITLEHIAGFQNYNFTFVSDWAQLETKNALITADSSFDEDYITDASLNLDNVNISLKYDKNVSFAKGSILPLIEITNEGFIGNINNSNITVKQGALHLDQYQLYVDSDVNTLYAQLEESGLISESKILSEGVAAGIALAGQSADVSGMLNAADGNLQAFGAVFGGSSKYDTGSSVELNSLGFYAGLEKKFSFANAGVFVEYANGSYDTEFNAAKGDGKTSLIGAGLAFKKDINEKVYVEAQVKAGQLSNDYNTGLTDDNGVNAEFDYSSMYFGGLIGAGYKCQASDKIDIKGFGKFIVSNVSSGDADLTTGEKYEFDAIMSNRIKAGITAGYKINETIKPYAGAALDYEISGDVNAKVDGEKVESPTLNGATIDITLGIDFKAGDKLNFNLGADIFAGQRAGFIGSLKIKYQI
ncbi:MAG: autotransporter outer membrane beta-barrel domain-containing protein [Endomicrobium sp.]|jgi:hypothetical protein|nr:autotransporter outer membrane beta-barrel domain-containing protein [Endomicrobium sp.]